MKVLLFGPCPVDSFFSEAGSAPTRSPPWRISGAAGSCLRDPGRRAGEPAEDPWVLTKIARKSLREKFLSADDGTSAANFT